jgi:calcyclin binding protein
MMFSPYFSVQIFISIEGVEQKKMEAVFNQTSVHMKFNDVYGKNYQWAIPKLNKEIVPEKCKAVVKPTKLVVTLCKASTGTWSNIYFEENKVITHRCVT